LATTVHVGPLKFCECFLESKEFNVNLQNELRTCMAEMLLLAKKALQINAGIINTKQVPLQDILEEKYSNLLQTFNEKYLGDLHWDKISVSMSKNKDKN